MATAMAQAPGDRRTHQWREVEKQLARVKGMEQAIAGEVKIEDLLRGEQDALQNMIKGMFGEDGPRLSKSLGSMDEDASTNDLSTGGGYGVSASRTNAPSRPSGRAEGGTTKKEFVEQIFGDDPDASLKDIQAAWKRAGNKDTISSSLVYKTKGELKHRRGGGQRRSAPKGQSKETAASSHAPQPAGDDIHAEVRRAAWEILSRDDHTDGLLVAEITEIIESKGLVTGLDEDNDLANIVQIELKRLRDEGRVERGDNRQYHIVKGAKLN